MAKDTFFQKKTTLNICGKLIDLGRPKVMGIINLTPDSFYEGSRISSVDGALQQAEKMLNYGATFLDLGAYSSRPGADDISVQKEMDRLLPVVETIAKQFPDAIISVDTCRAKVAETAVNSGAHIINDISGGSLDAEMFVTVAKLNVPYILMHMKGTPKTMNLLANYGDLFGEVYDYFIDKCHQLRQLGVNDVIIDPGFGFAKIGHQNYELMGRLQELNALQLPVLVGVSRKKMIQNLLGVASEDALNGTTILNTIALTKGANILRVHDVKEAVEAIKVWEAVNA